jgi:hypothetical protein
MTDHTIEANFKVSADMAAARDRGRRVDDVAVKMLAEVIGGDEALARAIYKAAFALPHIIKMAVEQIEKEDQNGQEENRAAGL